jgi:EAL domain-containing protein (putative c-di-GMP-specific phosphodiesterase class I)
VNVSPAQFRTGLADDVAAVLRRTGLAPARLSLEVTEGLLLNETPLVIAEMEALRAQGVQLVLDDFGTAHSSISYLQRFPFDEVKIDRSFVANVCEDARARAVFDGILQICHALDLDVVAEGVENEAQLALLRECGCRYVQGFLTGRPMSAPEARQMLWHLSATRLAG